VVAAFDKQVAEQIIPRDPRQLASHQGCMVSLVLLRMVARAGEFQRYARRLGIALTLAEATLKRIKLGTNFAVFLLFFGVAALEAFQTRNWIKAAFWLAIGVVFLAADILRKDG
jgi:hypothetical protein